MANYVNNLFLVRHGETEANKQGINAGPLDYPLSKKGSKDADYLAKTLSEADIVAVYSSPIFRALQTSKILARPHKLEVKIVEDLTEAKLKPKFVGKKGRQHILTDPKAFEESYQELQERMMKAVESIKNRERGNVIIVSHGDPLAALVNYFVERKTGENTHYVLHPDPGSLTIIESGKIPRLVLFNYHRRLFDEY